MSKLDKLMKNSAIFGISTFATKIISFLLVPMYTRVLTATEFGNADLIISVVSFFVPVFSLCVFEGILRFSIGVNSNKKHSFTYGLIVIFLGFILLLLLYPLLYRIEIIRDFIVYFYLIYISSLLHSYFFNFVKGLEKIRLIGITSVIGSLVLLVSNFILLVFFRMGVVGYLISTIAMYFVSSLIYFTIGRLWHYITFGKISTDLIRELNAYNIPLILTRIGWSVVVIFGRYSLNHFMGASAVGLYSAAYKVPSLILAVYLVFQQALHLSVIDEYESKNGVGLFVKSYKILSLLLLILVMTINVVIYPLARLIFANAFYDAYKIVPLLVAGTFFSTLEGNLSTIFSARKQTTVMLKNSMISAFLSVLFYTALIPFLGLFGAALATATVCISMWIRMIVLCRNSVDHFSLVWSDYFCYFIFVFQALLPIYLSIQYALILSLICLSFVLILKKSETINTIKLLVLTITKMVTLRGKNSEA